MQQPPGIEPFGTEKPLEPADETTWAAQLMGAIAFYTVVPIPIGWATDFRLVARWVPLVGILIGGLLALLDIGLGQAGMPVLVRSTLVVAAWVGITGGLHLDGAMDTADGLSVMDPQRRLEVMADSRTGALGAIAAILILLLKVTALADLPDHHWAVLLMATGWGRWGQQVAIARYLYLKPTGKGAFHKAALPSTASLLPGLLLLAGLGGLVAILTGEIAFAMGGSGLGGAIALLAPAWFNQRLHGHTGDTYGAVVEWTEALLLVCSTLLV